MLWHQSVSTLIALAAKERAIYELHRLLAERDDDRDTARHRADQLSGELATTLDQAALQHREHRACFRRSIRNLLALARHFKASGPSRGH